MSKCLILLILIISYSAKAEDIFVKGFENLKVRQFGYNWCWAATLESAYQFKGDKVTQLEIMQGYTRETREVIIQNKDSAFYGIPMSLFISTYLRGFREITKKQVKDSLKKDQPVILINNNHVSLIVGIYGNDFVIMDPAEGRFVVKNPHKIKFAYYDKKFRHKSEFYVVEK